MLLVFGSINLDIAFQAERLPLAGETVLGKGYLISPGGKGANQAHAARLYGAEVHMAGAVGRDAFAAHALERLDAAGVDLSGVQQVQAPTGCAGIVVDAQGENQIVVAPGANLALQSRHVADATLARAHAVLLQMETDAGENQLLLQRARRQGALAVLNNAPARALDAAMLQALDVLVVNQGELGATALGAGVAGTDSAQLVRALSARFGLTVVLTLGAQGVLACADSQMLTLPAFPVPVVDTTGAGDTFAGVLTAALMEGLTLPAALQAASAAAALACTRAGAQAAQPERAQIHALLARQAPRG
jgi:ribokinase